jgi:hypothetical protein
LFVDVANVKEVTMFEGFMPFGMNAGLVWNKHFLASGTFAKLMCFELEE